MFSPQNIRRMEVGVQITLPIGNRQAKADLGSSLAGKAQNSIINTAAKDGTLKEIRNALRSVNANEQRLSIKARELARNFIDSKEHMTLAELRRRISRLSAGITLIGGTRSYQKCSRRPDLNKAISSFAARRRHVTRRKRHACSRCHRPK